MNEPTVRLHDVSVSATSGDADRQAILTAVEQAVAAAVQAAAGRTGTGRTGTGRTGTGGVGAGGVPSVEQVQSAISSAVVASRLP